MSMQDATFVIGNTAIRIERMTFSAGRKPFFIVSRALLPVVARLIETLGLSSLKTAADELDLPPESLTLVVHEALDAIKDDDLEYLTKVFQDHAYVGGDKLSVVSDVLFAGEYGMYVEFMQKSVMHNFGSFFAGLAKKAGAKSEGDAPPESK